MSFKLGDGSRFAHLDGLRSIAIIWVVAFHYSNFWTSAGDGPGILPYDDALIWLPLANLGGFGVSLFFMISGFVIMLSLERSQSPRRFAGARLWRLLPTLVLCGTLTFLTTGILGPEILKRDFVEYAISIMFLPPESVGGLLGVSGMEWLDGAYWSLWTEVRFYAVIGFLYFWQKDRVYIFWTAFVLVSAVLHYAYLLSGNQTLDAITGLLFTGSQAYFTGGIALYLIVFEKHVKFASALLGGSLVHAFLVNGLPLVLSAHALNAPAPIAARLFAVVIVFALATAAAIRPPAVKLLSAGVFTLVGRASYPYYLLHQHFGLALLIGLGPTAAGASIAAMIGIQAGIILLSIIIYRYFERGLVASTRRRFSSVRHPLVS